MLNKMLDDRAAGIKADLEEARALREEAQALLATYERKHKDVQSLADEITEQLSIPTIGIGASAGCDGQILVVDDMLGLFTAFKPKFVKRYAALGDTGRAAIAHYAEEVRARRFPAPEHVFSDAPAGAKP